MIQAIIAGAVIALALTLPLAWKWELGVPRVAVAMVVFVAVGSVVAAAVGVDGALGAIVVAAVALLLALAALAYRFYRDPEREPPQDSTAIISPADGRVVYVRRSVDGIVPISTKQGRDYSLEELAGTDLRSRDAYVVGIAMSFLDVHVNRAPIGGEVVLHRHVPGLFGSLKAFEMMLRNERATTIIDAGGFQIAVIQIASRLVRQIASYVAEAERVVAGQRIGVIRLGSQVDVVIPATDVVVTVRAGQTVRAGESIIARRSTL